MNKLQIGNLYECHKSSLFDVFKLHEQWLYLGINKDHPTKEISWWIFYSIQTSSFHEWSFIEKDEEHWVSLFYEHFRKVELE